jgi:hypothetical protein
MTYSISDSKPFKEIEWESLKDRPSITTAMPFCEEKQWYKPAKCCMDGYTIEHILDGAYAGKNTKSPEFKFLKEYPCINGVELDSLIEKIEEKGSQSKLASQASYAEGAAPYRYIKAAISTFIKFVLGNFR